MYLLNSYPLLILSKRVYKAVTRQRETGGIRKSLGITIRSIYQGKLASGQPHVCPSELPQRLSESNMRGVMSSSHRLIPAEEPSSSQTETLVPTVLHLAHDAVVAGHPGRERMLTALRTHYFWPTMKIDVQKHVNRCVKCAQYKGVPSGPAPILQRNY